MQPPNLAGNQKCLCPGFPRTSAAAGSGPFSQYFGPNATFGPTDIIVSLDQGSFDVTNNVNVNNDTGGYVYLVWGGAP